MKKVTIYIAIVVFYTSLNAKVRSANYIAENNYYTQTMFINWKSENKIEFVFTVKEKNSPKQFVLKGIAISNSQDSEIDEDENGNAYPAIEYWYKSKDCEFSIRIAMEDSSKIQTTVGGCSKKNKENLPLQSISVLNKRLANQSLPAKNRGAQRTCKQAGYNGL